MEDYVINYTQTDGDTLHVINLSNEDYVIKSISEGTTSKVNWDLENKTFIRILHKEIDKISNKLNQQKITVGECYKYNKMDGVSLLESRINLNKDKLKYLTSFLQK